MLAVAAFAAAYASAQDNRRSTHKGQATAQRAALQWKNSQVRSYTELVWRYDDILGRKHMHFSYRPGSSTSLAYVSQYVLPKRKAVARKLHQQVRRVMVKRTKIHLTHISQLQMALGVTKPMRSLAEAENVEARFNQSRYLDQKLTKQWNESSLLKALKCIHGYEGAWNSNTGNGYYGGMQADRRFQQQYGPEFVNRWGTADHWPVWAQLVAAARAVRGWAGPDPATRKARGFHPWPSTAHACGLI